MACIMILFLAITFVIHRILLSKEKQMLTEAGYYNPVSVGDYSLNVHDFGIQNGKHTFVGLSGKGVFDYSVRMERLMGGLAEENRIVIVDRAGYGLSDDIRKRSRVSFFLPEHNSAITLILLWKMAVHLRIGLRLRQIRWDW